MVSTQATGDPAGRFGLAGGSGSIETDSMSSPVAICGFSGSGMMLMAATDGDERAT